MYNFGSGAFLSFYYYLHIKIMMRPLKAKKKKKKKPIKLAHRDFLYFYFLNSEVTKLPL